MDARAWLVTLAFWLALGLVESSTAWVRARNLPAPQPWWHALWANVPWWLLWAPLTPPALALARRAPLLGERWPRAVAVHAVASLLFAVVHLLVEGAVFWWTVSRVHVPSLTAQWRALFINYLPLEVVTYWAVIGAAHAIDAQRRWRDAAVEAAQASARAARLELGLAEARLQALRMELNPHFLFNALNAVSGLVRRDERENAVRMLARLGELLRATLDRDAASEHTLEEELALLERYVDIERARFGDRLTVTVGASAEARRALVPAFLLQPLVENAIRHGVARRPGAARVAVSAWREGARLELVVEDDGAGLRGPPREGIGLSNTRARLAARWGAAATLALESVPGGGARLRLSFPYAPVALPRAEVVHA
jgi:two-component system LytT family sensor kinase